LIAVDIAERFAGGVLLFLFGRSFVFFSRHNQLLQLSAFLANAKF
jgi:hypothetical protein